MADGHKALGSMTASRSVLDGSARRKLAEVANATVAGGRYGNELNAPLPAPLINVCMDVMTILSTIGQKRNIHEAQTMEEQVKTMGGCDLLEDFKK